MKKRKRISQKAMPGMYLMFKKYPRVTDSGRAAALEKVMTEERRTGKAVSAVMLGGYRDGLGPLRTCFASMRASVHPPAPTPKSECEGTRL